MRTALKKFANAQEVILKDNDQFKAGWEYCSNSHLLRKLKTEVAELELALIDGDKENIKYECCDVANYAMMLFDNQEE